MTTSTHQVPSATETQDKSLTALELHALGGSCNLADAHPRQAPSERQQRILLRVGEWTALPGKMMDHDVDRRAQKSFLHALGQKHAPVDDGRTRTFYSSSVAIVAAAQIIVARGGRVALLSPTFDNIPDILRRHGAQLLAVREEEITRSSDFWSASAIDALFLTTPNNPTGWVLPSETLSCLARRSAERGTLLVLDSSFRGFDPAAQYDTYSILEKSRCSYLVIEDTGKLWPTQELKVGVLAVSDSCREDLIRAANEILLSVSPVILTLVEHLAREAATGGFASLHRLIRMNRLCVEAFAGTIGARLINRDSLVSVALMQLPNGTDAARVTQHLSAEGVDILPAEGFFWADPAEGREYIRIALARDSEVVAHGMATLAEWLGARSQDDPESQRPTPAGRELV